MAEYNDDRFSAIIIDRGGLDNSIIITNTTCSGTNRPSSRVGQARTDHLYEKATIVYRLLTTVVSFTKKWIPSKHAQTYILVILCTNSSREDYTFLGLRETW
jgi:hypothetical protein